MVNSFTIENVDIYCPKNVYLNNKIMQIAFAKENAQQTYGK